MPQTPHFDTPIRRSGISANRSQIIIPTVNDDEAERQESREQASFVNHEDTTANKEGLEYCLKVFNENKITKDNAWKMSLIDNFSALIARHHKSLQNFQIISTTLEASSKIYSLRVDSVHTSVTRITSGLIRGQSANPNRNNNDESGIINQDDSDNESRVTENKNQQPQPKRKRVKKTRSTVAKSKESINAKLETIPFTDPFFAQQNFTLDINSSDHLMQNIMPSTDSILKLQMNYPFWDSTELSINLMDKYEHENWIALSSQLSILKKYVLRPQLTGYKITNTPAEDDSKNDSIPGSVTVDQSQLDVAFDIDADVEPITEMDHFVDVDLNVAGLNDELTVHDQLALQACKGLRRQPLIVEDLRPVDSSSQHLEYSYRPMDNISQFWAGPSHWKFRSFRSNRSTNILPHAAAKGTLNRRGLRKQYSPEEISDHCPDGIFLEITQKMQAKLRKANIYRKWDPKELKLPPNMHLDRNRFMEYSLAPGLAITCTEPSTTPDIETSAYNYNNANDQEYCSNIEPENDYDTERSGSVAENIDIPMPMDERIQNDNTVCEINTIFANAPLMVEKIVVPFATKAKVVDMKQLKKSCLSLIHLRTNDIIVEIDGETTSQSSTLQAVKKLGFQCQENGLSFKKMYKKLPQIITKNLQEVLTPSVAFYAILHLANDNRLCLTSLPNNDFVIREILN